MTRLSYGAAIIMRRFRGHAHPVPIRHRFPQLPAANHRAVALRLQLKLQQTIHKLEHWADLNSFKFAEDKCNSLLSQS